MAQIDPSIPLAARLPEFMSPQQMVTLQQLGQQGQIQQLHMADMLDARSQRNAMRTALEAPDAIDPNTGRLTATTLQNVTRLNPEMGLGLTRQQEQLRLQDLANIEKRNEVAKNVGTAYVTAYDRYLQQFGGDKDKAANMARLDGGLAVNELEDSGALGFLDPQAIANLRKFPDPEAARSYVMALGGRVDRPVDATEGKLEPKDYTPESWAEYKRSRDSTVLRKAITETPRMRNRIAGTNEIQEEYDPVTKTWKEIGRGPRFATTQADAAGRSYIPAEHANLHGEEYLATLPPGVRSSVKAIAEGRTPLSTLSIRGGEREAMLQRVSQFDPTFDAGIAPARVATRKDFTSGPASRNVTAINTAIGHLGTLDELGDALKNKDTRLLNTVFNRIATETGNANVNNFDIARDAVGHELMRVFRQVGASKEESDAFQAKFQAANSPDQLKGAVKTAAELLQSRIEALDDQWKRGMNTDKGYPDLLSPKSKQVMERVKNYGAKGSAAPAGSAGNFSSLWR